jgi:hypothetical protein
MACEVSSVPLSLTIIRGLLRAARMASSSIGPDPRPADGAERVPSLRKRAPVIATNCVDYDLLGTSIRKTRSHCNFTEA